MSRASKRDGSPRSIEPADKPIGASGWIRRAGLAGFAFFLAKGLFWLALGAWAFTGEDCSPNADAHTESRQPAEPTPQ